MKLRNFKFVDGDRYGATFDRPLPQPIYVHYLPEMGKGKTLKGIERVIQGGRAQLTSLLEKAKQQEMMGEIKPKLRDMLETLQLEITDLLRQRNLVEKMPFILGKVLVTSGASVLGDALMDWAFIEVSKEIENQYFHQKYVQNPGEHQARSLQGDATRLHTIYWLPNRYV